MAGPCAEAPVPNSCSFVSRKSTIPQFIRCGLRSRPVILKTAMRVFVLGAGASHDAGYPLAAEMGKGLAAWITTLSSEHKYRSCLDQIAGLYGELDDFEAILADLMTCPVRVQPVWG